MSIFEREYYLRTSDFDKYMNLTPTGILDLFQDVAGAHALELGCGLYDMTKKGIAWILMGVRYTVLKETSLFDKVKVVTWPLPVRGVRYNREYLILNEAGDVLVKGTSTWVIINISDKKIISDPSVYSGIESFNDVQNFPDKYVRIKPFDGDDTVLGFSVARSDIDFNGHANNVRYAKYIYDALPLEEGDYFKEFQIDYHRELLLSQPFSITYKREADGYLVTGKTEQEASFTARAVIEKSPTR